MSPSPEDSSPGERLVCPSYPTDRATFLLGVVVDGRLRFKSDLMAVPSEVRSGSLGLTAGLRFAGPCITRACDYWEGHCALGDEVMAMEIVEVPDVVPCPIVDRCRWRHEQGDEVCDACPGVTYVATLT